MFKLIYFIPLLSPLTAPAFAGPSIRVQFHGETIQINGTEHWCGLVSRTEVDCEYRTKQECTNRLHNLSPSGNGVRPEDCLTTEEVVKLFD